MSSYSFQGDKRIWTPRNVEENRAIFSAQRQETGISMPDEFKPIYLVNAELEAEKWGINLIMRLLRLYGSHRCLWDVRYEDNRNKKLREAALLDIAAAMGGGITRSQVAQKINVLRATYRYERRRIKQRMRKGIGARTKLRWFALADSFLREVPKIERGRRRNEQVDSDSDLENEMVLTIDPDVVMPIKKEVIQSDNFNDSVKIEHENSVDIKSCNELQSRNFDCGDFITPSSSHNTPLKPKWTLEHSLKLVELLKAHPVLWSKEFNENEEQRSVALELIAQAMDMALSRVKCRVNKFKDIFTEVCEKRRTDTNYAPHYSWWETAECLMHNEENTEIGSFVDVNAAIPATPMQHLTEYGEYIESPATPKTPINPIPSVSVPTALEADAEDSLGQLFSKTDLIDDISMSSTAQPTRLIWNGLAEDLLEGKWSLKHSVKFLRLYGTHRCLWDLTDPDYRSRELRAAAIEDIAAAMGYGLNADYVAKKIKIFRITYMQHRKRLLEAIKTGQEPEIQLRWFPLADSFLRPHIGLRSIKEQEREIPQFDYQYVMANLNLIDPELLNDFRDKIPRTSTESSNERVGVDVRCIKTEGGSNNDDLGSHAEEDA